MSDNSEVSNDSLSQDETSHTLSAEVAAALRAGDFDGAARLSANMPPSALVELAERLMRCRRWDEAAWLLAEVPARDAAAQMKLNFSRNLASLQQYRPSLYAQLIDLPSDDRFGAAPSPTGPLTVLARKEDGSVISLSGGADPVAAVAQALTQVRSATPQGEPVGLCGIGDGYLLKALSAHPPVLPFAMEQPLFVVEVDAPLLLLCLMIHDYSGPTGPIEQARVQWFVGDGCKQELRDLALRDPFLGLPAVIVPQGLRGAEARDEMNALAVEIGGQSKALETALREHYAAVTPAALAELFGPKPPRRPRVMLLTTRFSTVLQYATRDAATALEQAGWEPHVLIEPSPSHRLYRATIRRVLADVRPDIIFQIDHLRHEHRDMFPPGLPFVCWIQDHLSNLLNEKAGRSVGVEDFILTDAASTYVRRYGYPGEQMIPLAKLTPSRPPVEATGPVLDQITFVSNASRPPEQLLYDAAAAFKDEPAEQMLALSAGQRLIDTYYAGETVSTYLDVAGYVREVQAELGVLLSDEGFHRVARWLYHPFNDALYRQQALWWAADVAGELGLELCLYGAGWDRHPQLAPYAKGPVQYGEPLAELTRRSAINLQVVPYLCLHQRLLDGLMAGGFFLVRSHPADVAPQAMADLLFNHFDPSIRTLAAARAAAPPPVRGRFEALVNDCRRCLCSTGPEDPIEMVRDWEAAQLLVPGEGVLPRLAETRFSTAAELKSRVRRFIEHPATRTTIAEAQRTSVMQRLSYEAGMTRVARSIGEALARRIQPVSNHSSTGALAA